MVGGGPRLSRVGVVRRYHRGRMTTPLEPSGERPSRTVYTGERIALEPLDPERHTASLYAVSHGDAEREAIWTWMPDGPFATEAEMRERLRERIASPDLQPLAVVERATNRAIGMACFMAIEPGARRLEVGFIWYGLDHRGGAANNEAMLLMLGEAFDRLGYRRVEWKCDADNERSRRAAVRLGFTFEGLFRQHMIIKGRNRDTAWFSMLDSEWPAARARLEQAVASPQPRKTK